MVFAWSFTEVIRYSFYALSLVEKPPTFLLWLRYTTFYVFYPIGASSEAFLIYATLPTSPFGKPTAASLIYGTWFIPDYIRGLMFLIWWPGTLSSAQSYNISLSTRSRLDDVPHGQTALKDIWISPS